MVFYCIYKTHVLIWFIDTLTVNSSRLSVPRFGIVYESSVGTTGRGPFIVITGIVKSHPKRGWNIQCLIPVVHGSDSIRDSSDIIRFTRNTWKWILESIWIF